MPRTKTEEFKTADVQLAKLAKALAHPARIANVRTLARRNECICGEIVEVLPLAQATDLKALKAVSLIDGTVEGPRSCYCINWENLRKVDKLFGRFIKSLGKAGSP